ncbi:2-amino-5-chlorophenol 1,6-dioxygenase subunit alpha [Pseudonocardia spinosispora]|uniref:DODA-type extradiol aromatic ring-opening family dioxygenase n=1 Tax=Pseudonocardia spinosispora TaxID=103441 RepID=UPI0004134A78|nr:2-amino-5-chlorophenol 1,6-dioxygenase subunit alpha [Pseudonocardia spinosispora]
MADGLVAAAIVPGLPHLLAERDPAPSWTRLADAVRVTGDRFRDAGVDTVVMVSTQWFTVLGHQVQLDPHLVGEHVDENWYGYDFGRQRYDMRVDTELASGWADEIDRAGLQSRRTRYDGFPIDTGTMTAMGLLDPARRLRLALVSCNLYAGPDAMASVGAAATASARTLGRRVAAVAVTSLSSGLIQRWICPGEDHVTGEGHEQWDRRVLDLVTEGKHADVLALREEYSAEAQADSQFRTYPFLTGAGLDRLGRGELLAYGPIWGTGAAVVNWMQEE